MSRAAKPFILTLDISEVFCYFILCYNLYCSEGYRFTTKQYPSYVLQGIHPSLKEFDTMSNYITYEERMEVENCLFNGKSFGEIAKVLGKDRCPGACAGEFLLGADEFLVFAHGRSSGIVRRGFSEVRQTAR